MVAFDSQADAIVMTARLSFYAMLAAVVLAGCASAAPQQAATPVTPSAPVRLAAAAPVTQAAPPAVVPPPIVVPPEPQLSAAEVQTEANKLRAALAAEVKGSSEPLSHEPDWIGLAKAALAASAQPPIDRPQLIVVVDRSSNVQAMRLVLARPGNDAWEILGGTHVSTGQTGRFDHYVTPLGVFPHTDAILDWRAEGTFNENHIRGLGLKGMRIWDFGWQVAVKGWLDNQSGPMRLLMHATDPANLEHRIGRRASSGCVRIPAVMNLFLDRHGVLDHDYERAARDDIRYRALLRPDRTPTPLSGTLLIVVDSSASTTTATR
jgi:hypothetical protein